MLGGCALAGGCWPLLTAFRAKTEMDRGQMDKGQMDKSQMDKAQHRLLSSDAC